MKLLQSNRWRLWLEPARGVQWMAAEVYQRDRWVPVVSDCRPFGYVDEPSLVGAPHSRSAARAGQDENAPLLAANFHMIPYCNRIRDGHFHYDGKEVQLADAGSHSIHGALRKLPWRTVSNTENSLMCSFSAPTDGHINWPWPMTAEISYTVHANTISSKIRVRNEGDSQMPVGFGWHPYFVRTIGGESPTLCIPVAAVYPDTDGDCLPTGPSSPLPEKLNFQTPRALDENQRIDHCFSGFDGTVAISWPQSNIHLRMSASKNCGHLVLFNPDKPHFAVEPVTNANDAFNLANQGIDSGVIYLEPGAWATADFSLRIE